MASPRALTTWGKEQQKQDQGMKDQSMGKLGVRHGGKRKHESRMICCRTWLKGLKLHIHSEVKHSRSSKSRSSNRRSCDNRTSSLGSSTYTSEAAQTSRERAEEQRGLQPGQLPNLAQSHQMVRSVFSIHVSMAGLMDNLRIEQRRK